MINRVFETPEQVPLLALIAVVGAMAAALTAFNSNLAVAMFYYLSLILPWGILSAPGIATFALVGVLPMLGVWLARQLRRSRPLPPVGRD